MPWDSNFSGVAKTSYEAISQPTARPLVELAKVDLSRVVCLDFETYWDNQYTLSKLSTSDYVRDERFKPHMMGLKIGERQTKVIHDPFRMLIALKSIDWSTHGLLCHNTAFDGLILQHHFGVVPRFYFDTLSMARGLHSNDIGAGLAEVAEYYGVGTKIKGVLENSNGLIKLPRALRKDMAEYCAKDVDLCFDIFVKMLKVFPAAELDLVHHIIRMFCDPVLFVDRPAVAAEHAKEVKHKTSLLMSVLTPTDRATGTEDEQIAKARKVIGSRDGYVALLRAEGIEPPTKISPTTDEVTWAFAKTDIEFQALLEHPKQRVRDLVEARLGVRSSLNETRALRFLKATENGWALPVGYSYYRAHTGRLGGSNKMNMQNLQRGGVLRKSIKAPPGYVLPVCDSGQIEARINAWLWGQDDLLAEFRAKDAGLGVDPYCTFATLIYGRPIGKQDEIERFVGKTCVLGLGFQMGAAKLQNTLATGGSGGQGPKVFMELDEVYKIVNAYRLRNHRIRWGWDFCAKTIIPSMAAGRSGQWKCLYWEKERIWLPNGMCLKYPDLRLISDPESQYEEYQYASKDQPKKLYGGLLTENIVQALARIVVGGQLLEIAKKNRIVMMTHDEVVALTKAKQGQAVLARMIKTMSTSPPWCADLPLTAEGSVAAHYSK